MPFGLGIFNRNNATNNRQAAVPPQRATRFFGAVAVFFGCGTDDVMPPVNVSFAGEEDAEDDSRCLSKPRSASLSPLHGSQSNLNSVKNASETVENKSPEDAKKGKIIAELAPKVLYS